MDRLHPFRVQLLISGRERMFYTTPCHHEIRDRIEVTLIFTSAPFGLRFPEPALLAQAMNLTLINMSFRE